MIDLHTHSNASDGELSPAALMRAAAAGGLKAIALTDHDTTSGLQEAAGEAKRLGLHFVPGVELDIAWTPPAPRGEFHLLGLGLGRLSGGFLAALSAAAARREARNREILERMREAGIDARWEEVTALSGGESLGRPHFAAYLVQKGAVKNQEQAFARYLGRGMPFYIAKPGIGFDEAARIIHESGGAAVLAHPRSLYLSWGRMPGVIAGLRERGLDGLEAWHPSAKVRYCRRLEETARSLGLLVTAGSDFHGSARPGRKLGLSAGGRPIDDAFLEGLAERGFLQKMGSGE